MVQGLGAVQLRGFPILDWCSPGGKRNGDDFCYSVACDCHVHRNRRRPLDRKEAYAHPGLLHGPAGGLDMRLRYGGRSPSDNVSEGAMVPPESSLHDVNLPAR